MGITITEDEADKRTRGASETRREIVQRHAKNSSDARQELAEMDIQINRTRLVSKAKKYQGEDPNPEYAYRLVNRTKDGERIALLQGFGYETVPEDDDTKLVMSSPKDGCQVQGDLVLMRTPVANYERRRQAKLRRLAAMEGRTIEDTKERMNEIARNGGLAKPHRDAVE